MPSGAERRLFFGTAALVLLLDVVTKALAEAYLLRTTGIPVVRRLVPAAPGLQPGGRLRAAPRPLLPLDLPGPRARCGRDPHPDVRASPPPATASASWRSALVAAGRPATWWTGSGARSGVVDFLDVGLGTLRWPTFNVADMAVSCGAVALAISLWIEDSRQARHETASAG